MYQTLLESAEIMCNHPWNTVKDAMGVGRFNYDDPMEWLEDQDTLNLYAEMRIDDGLGV